MSIYAEKRDVIRPQKNPAYIIRTASASLLSSHLTNRPPHITLKILQTGCFSSLMMAQGPGIWTALAGVVIFSILTRIADALPSPVEAMIWAGW